MARSVRSRSSSVPVVGSMGGAAGEEDSSSDSEYIIETPRERRHRSHAGKRCLGNAGMGHTQVRDPRECRHRSHTGERPLGNAGIGHTQVRNP